MTLQLDGSAGQPAPMTEPRLVLLTTPEEMLQPEDGDLQPLSYIYDSEEYRGLSGRADFQIIDSPEYDTDGWQTSGQLSR